MKIFIFLLILNFLLVSCGDIGMEPDNDFNLTALQLTDTEVQLNWIDNFPDEHGFKIQRKKQGYQYNTIDQTTADITQFNDTGIETYTRYYYRIAAVFNGEQSDWSNEATIYTQPVELFFGTDSTLEVMSWNLKQFPLSDSTVILVIQSLNQLNVDVIAFQEIENNNAFQNMAAGLPQWQAFRSGDSSSNEMELAYLINTEAVEILDEPYEIFESDSYAFPREPYVVKLGYNGMECIIINNHLKALSGEEDEERRRQACLKLKEYVDNNLPDDNVILLGDMNDDLTDDASENVFQDFLDDSENYLFADIDIAQGSTDDWSYPSWPSHLDHILITNELFDEFNAPNSQISTIKIEEHLDGGLNTYQQHISDHRPLALKLYIQ